MMTRTHLKPIHFAVVLLVASTWIPAREQSPQARSSEKVLKLTVSYSGPGTVDRTRAIHLFFFDAPDFVRDAANATPIDMRTVHSNGETLTLRPGRNIVYVAAAYDEQGVYEAPAGPPPKGTPVAVYAPDDPEAPTPIRLGAEVTEVEFVFDDSTRMP